MTDYDWPTELDADSKDVDFSKDLDFAALQPPDTATMMALMRIREHHRHQQRLQDIEEQRQQRHAEIDREFNQDMKRVYLKCAFALTLSAAILAAVTWLLN